MSTSPRTIGPATVRDHIKINAVNTKTAILAIDTAETAMHGMFYLPNNALEIYVGDYDGKLIKLGTSNDTSWVVSDGTNTGDIQAGAQLNIVGSGIVETALSGNTLGVSIKTTGASNGQVLIFSGGTISWANIPSSYITAISDTNTIDLTVTGTTLKGDVILDPSGNNNLTQSVSGLMSKKLTVSSGSTSFLSIDPSSYEISISSLSITDVTVDTTYSTISAWATANYTGTEFQEGDVIILTTPD